MGKNIQSKCTTLGTITELKEKYNNILKTFWKATMHLESPNLTYKQQEKWIPKYEEVVKECQSYLTQLYNLGYRATEEEIKGGFDLCSQDLNQGQQLILQEE